MMRAALLSLTGIAAVAFASCSTPTPYQPIEARSGVSGGYSDQRLTDNRYRVSFAGNGVTARDTVENYLLYRAAELTVQQGYDNFVLAQRDVERDRRTVVTSPYRPGRFGYWGPSWRYYGARHGWRAWDPYWGDPFWMDDVDTRTIDRYEAIAEIVMRRGAVAPDDVRAFNARDILAQLGPTIRRPA